MTGIERIRPGAYASMPPGSERGFKRAVAVVNDDGAVLRVGWYDVRIGRRVDFIAMASAR